MKNLLFFAAILLASCTSTLDKKVNLETLKSDLAEIKKDTAAGYTAEDFTALKSYVEGYAMGKALLDEKTLAKVKIRTYRDVLDESKKQRLYVDSITKIMKNDLRLFGLYSAHAKQDFQDYYVMLFEVENHSGKSISAFRGALKMWDQFGDTLGAFTVEYDSVIAPNETKKIEQVWEIEAYNSNVNKLSSTPFDKLKFWWYPEQIIFSDGSKLIHPTNN